MTRATSRPTPPLNDNRSAPDRLDPVHKTPAAAKPSRNSRPAAATEHPPATPPPALPRRQFLTRALAATAAAASTAPWPHLGLPAHAATPAAPRPESSTDALRDRIHGLLLGSLIGDALGGPIEFQPRERVAALPDPPKSWNLEESFDDAARAATRERLRLRSYSDLRPEPEPYAHWTRHAAPGTITDDSRHKLVLLFALREAERRRQWPLTRAGLAQAYLDWPTRSPIKDRPEFAAICRDWIEEWNRGARWVLGNRKTPDALPPQRMWAGLPTCCGQMTLPPLAALFPGRPDDAYRAAYQLAFFDNGFGLDLNAALIAGLAAALAAPATPPTGLADWEPVLAALRNVDPFGYARVPWVTRPVHRWLGVALDSVQQADRRPGRLFATLETEFRNTIKWEAQVPFVLTFACLAIAAGDPLAALQLSLEWGHDTDSYAQLVGAFVGARYGTAIFPASMRAAVTQRLLLDYGENVSANADLLDRLANRNRNNRLVTLD